MLTAITDFDSQDLDENGETCAAVLDISKALYTV